MSTGVARSVRFTLAEKVLASDPGRSIEIFEREVAPTLMNTVLCLPRAAEGDALARKVAGRLADAPSDPRALIAAMLVLFPHELPRLDPEQVPEWLRLMFLEYLHIAPMFFPRQEDREAYVDFLSRWADRMLQEASNPGASTAWTSAVAVFVDRCNLFPAYFSTRDLTSLCVTRGRTIDAAMRSVGYRLDYAFPKRQGGRVRIGFFRETWMPQTETFATLPLFEHLDRHRFEVVLFAPSAVMSEIDAYARSRADAVVHLSGTIPEQVDQARRADLDILFFGANLAGGMSPAVSLAYHRIARVQVASICCPVTTGIPTIDYFIAGTLTEADADAQGRYSERLIRFEGSGICFRYDMHLPPSLRGLNREMLGIGPATTVMVSGANLHKIGEAVRQAWVDILAAVPDSCLVLYPMGPAWSQSYAIGDFIEDFFARLDANGVSRKRLIVLKAFESVADISGLLSLCDLYLDSFPYSGATSLLDPLQLGLPPVVMAGRQLRFAQADAMMVELGMPELIAPDVASYVRLAVALAKDPERRDALRASIRAKMAMKPPFLDSMTFARKAAAAFDRMLPPPEVQCP